MNILEIIKDKKYLCNSDFSYYRNIEEVKNNKLYFCAYGGGFVKTISLENENFLNDIKDKKIIFTNEEPKEEYHFGKIYLDSYNGFQNFVEGYIHNHRFWNGWNIVYMTLEGIKKHNELIKNSPYYSDNWEPTQEEFNPTFHIINDDTIILYDQEEEGGKVEIKSTQILFEGKKIKVFNPCSMGWTWQEITK